MRGIISVAAIVAAISLASPASATGFKYTDNSIDNAAKAEAVGVGVGKGIGIGKGGRADADANATGIGFGGKGGNATAVGLGGKGGDASAHSGAFSGSSSGVSKSGNSLSKSGVYGSGNSETDVETTVKTRVGVDTSQGQIGINKQGQEQTQGQIGVNANRTNNSDSVVVEGDDIDNTTVVITPAALSNLPAANCQGVSTTATLGLGSGVFGGALGGGRSEESDDCNIRENIKLLVHLMGAGFYKGETVEIEKAITEAMGQTTGFAGFLSAGNEEVAEASSSTWQQSAETDEGPFKRRDK